MATTLLDRLFTPHGPEAYLRWVPTVGRGRTENPDPTERKNEVDTADQPETIDLRRAPGETEVVVRFAASDLVVEPVGTLLETAEAAGLEPRYRCRRGICGTCTTPKQSGTVRDVRTGETSDEPGPIRICVTEACDAVTLDL